MKKLFTGLCAASMVLSSTAYADSMSCQDYAHEVYEAENTTWEDVLSIGAGAVSGVVAALGVMSLSAAVPMEAAGPKTKVLIYGSIVTAGLVVGGSMYFGIEWVTSNTNDILDISDELEIGSGQTLGVFIDSVRMKIAMSEGGTFNIAKAPSPEKIKETLATVLLETPEICDNANSEEVLKTLSEIVIARLN
jgi:hypothetical protein